MQNQYFFDMDGTLAVYEREAYEPFGNHPWYEKLRGTHYYRTLAPHTDMVNLVKRHLRKHPDRVWILTSIDHIPNMDFYEHAADKVMWVQQYLPCLLPDHFLVVRSRHPEGKETKSKVAVRALGRPLLETDHLYDDYNPNLEEWRAAGGRPIKVINGINHARLDMGCYYIRESLQDRGFE